ncbi:hypothetical protein BDF22DRAFT_743869 [Syncephalis plumigaleata]|nr:hypothetical protein BDF22DRAFT_743869 [Syncephalis plumigaleata]
MTPPTRPVHDQPQVILDMDVAVGRWKISPDWLEIRNDHTAFATIWSNCPVTLGTWYYEVTMITSGIMQIGWTSLTGDNIFECDEGIGVGDTVYSLGYDANTLSEHCFSTWKEGDILGVWLHLDEESPQYRFYLNGVEQPHTTLDVECEGNAEQWLKSVARMTRLGHYQMFPAASFTAGQQAEFNFGITPFRFPPPGAYDTLTNLITSRPELMVEGPSDLVFNTPCWTRPDSLGTAAATVTTTIRGDTTGFDIIERRQSSSTSTAVSETEQEVITAPIRTLCEICCNAYADTLFLPCRHSDVCARCARRCGTICPWCRSTWMIL